MSSGRFWTVPEKRRLLTAVLVLLIVLFFSVLIFRSCRRPESVSSAKYLSKLSDPVVENRIDAVLGLGRVGAKDAVPELEKILSSDPDGRVQRAAAHSILVLDRGKLVSLLKSPAETVRVVSLETFGRQEKESAYTYLQDGLLDQSLLVRHTALNFLLQLSGPQALETVLRLAENTREDTALRIEALNGLVKKAGEKELPRLKDLASWEPDEAVRGAAKTTFRETEVRIKKVKE